MFIFIKFHENSFICSTIDIVMQIRYTEIQDIGAVMKIYADARIFMKEHGNTRQWYRNAWPPESLIREDIQKHRSYVCMNGNEIVGVFCMIKGKHADPLYDDIEGKWHKDAEYGVVHRLAVKQGYHAGTFCINWAYEKCGYLRADTHPDNTVMQNLFDKLGFQKCGIVHVVEDDDPRLAYDKV